MEYGRQPGDDSCQAGLAANSVERWSKSAFDSGQVGLAADEVECCSYE